MQTFLNANAATEPASRVDLSKMKVMLIDLILWAGLCINCILNMARFSDMGWLFFHAVDVGYLACSKIEFLVRLCLNLLYCLRNVYAIWFLFRWTFLSKRLIWYETFLYFKISSGSSSSQVYESLRGSRNSPSKHQGRSDSSCVKALECNCKFSQFSIWDS